MTRHLSSRRPIRHKFNAQAKITDGIRFASKKEAKYYEGLVLRRRAGGVLFFLRQVPLHLPGNIRYIVDFVEFLADGSVHFVDVKGFKTAEYKAKKRTVEALYPIKITEA